MTDRQTGTVKWGQRSTNDENSMAPSGNGTDQETVEAEEDKKDVEERQERIEERKEKLTSDDDVANTDI